MKGGFASPFWELTFWEDTEQINLGFVLSFPKAIPQCFVTSRYCTADYRELGKWHDSLGLGQYLGDMMSFSPLLLIHTKALASLRAEGSWCRLHASCRSVAALAGGWA